MSNKEKKNFNRGCTRCTGLFPFAKSMPKSQFPARRLGPSHPEFATKYSPMHHGNQKIPMLLQGTKKIVGQLCAKVTLLQFAFQLCAKVPPTAPTSISCRQASLVPHLPWLQKNALNIITQAKYRPACLPSGQSTLASPSYYAFFARNRNRTAVTSSRKIRRPNEAMVRPPTPLPPTTARMILVKTDA